MDFASMKMVNNIGMYKKCLLVEELAEWRMWILLKTVNTQIIWLGLILNVDAMKMFIKQSKYSYFILFIQTNKQLCMWISGSGFGM